MCYYFFIENSVDIVLINIWICFYKNIIIFPIVCFYIVYFCNTLLNLDFHYHYHLYSTHIFLSTKNIQLAKINKNASVFFKQFKLSAHVT